MIGLNQAMESLSPRDYMVIMGDVFSGKSDMGAVDDFINATFDMPDVTDIKIEIFEGVTNYLNDNLPNLKVGTDQSQSLDQE